MNGSIAATLQLRHRGLLPLEKKIDPSIVIYVQYYRIIFFLAGASPCGWDELSTVVCITVPWSYKSGVLICVKAVVAAFVDSLFPLTVGKKIYITSFQG